MSRSMYGFFPGGDPRNFTPDDELNTPQELENHRLACEAWEKGDEIEMWRLTQSGCVLLPDGSLRNISHLGLGVYMYWDEDDEDEE